MDKPFNRTVDGSISDGSELTFPYDDNTPFGTYRPSGKHELVYSVFRKSLLPRGSVWQACLRSTLRRHGSEILDVHIDDLSLRMKPRFNSVENEYLRKGRLYDEAEIDAIANACNSVKNPVFIDIGANIGLYSLLVAKSVLPPPLRIFAVEPHPRIRKQLDYNIRLNSEQNISVREFAISDQSGWVWMKFHERNIGMTRIEEGGDVKVKCMTLLEMVNSENLNNIDALKLDVEGFEDKVLIPFFRAAQDSLLPKVIVLEVYLSRFWDDDPINVALTRGYRELKRNKMNSILIRG